MSLMVFGQFAIEDGSMWPKLVKRAREIVREPYTSKGSTTRIDFIKDLNGIWLEIVERE